MIWHRNEMSQMNLTFSSFQPFSPAFLNSWKMAITLRTYQISKKARIAMPAAAMMVLMSVNVSVIFYPLSINITGHAKQ